MNDLHQILKTTTLKNNKKIKTTTIHKTLLRKWKDKPLTERKYLKYIYPMKDWYPKYIKNLLFNIKNTYNSI